MYNLISVSLEQRGTMDKMFKAAHSIGDVMGEFASPGPAYASGRSTVKCGNKSH